MNFKITARSIAAIVSIVSLNLLVGCNEGSSDNNISNSNSSGSYAGTWSGNVCGRDLTMTINQNGTSLNGSYTLSDPTFTENFSGTVASETPAASATLNGGGDRRFEISFESYTKFAGGYFKGATKVCDTGATKQ